MKNNHRPSLARPRNPSSKLVPSSATKSTRLCRIRPEPDDRGRSSRLVNSATAPWSRGARPPRVHQHAPPRAELKKMWPQAGGIFDMSGARRTRRRPRAGGLPKTMHGKPSILKSPASREATQPVIETRSEFRNRIDTALPHQTRA